MTIPEAFTPDYLSAHRETEQQYYREFLNSGEPYRSLARRDFHQSARTGYHYDTQRQPENTPTPGLDLQDDQLYYNTGGSAAAYWADFDLPQPQQEIGALREDLQQWGYCLIREGLSTDQYQRMKQRLEDQAAGERKAGIACWTGTPNAPGESVPRSQFLHSLINKGEQFVGCVEHDPEAVQAGPLIEALLGEIIGRDFLMSSFIAIISNPFNMPQTLHQDQAIAPFQDPRAPFTCNTMFVMDDMGEHNGGTLVVPGSHRLLSQPTSGSPLTTPLPPAINLQADAGTVVIFEGRLLHGTGVNKSDHSRMILVMNSIKPFMRQQELHLLSAAPEILENASAKLAYRLGARPTGLGGIEGAWQGDFLIGQRLAFEQGNYRRVRELSPDSPAEELAADYGYRHSDTGIKLAAAQPEALDAVASRFGNTTPRWRPGAD
jgi:ectoine hydroxylase-related dioxygenase (phytanoyl-CoA dioxygenase family)